MKSFLDNLRRVLGAIVYANYASNLGALNKLLEQEDIRPISLDKPQNVARAKTAAFVPESRHLSLID